MIWGGVVLVCGFLVGGCTPPGPKALLEGRRLLDAGKAEEAIPLLLQATELLPTNALAWSSLGVAYHQNGKTDQAFRAYQTALKLDHTMGALRFNLGCLYLDMNNVGTAIDELRAFTLLQPNSLEGWVKLGTAQYRARRLDDAEKSFKNALGIQARNPEAWNGQGLIQVQRRRWSEAINLFTAAHSADTNFAAALLNAAVVQHQYLNNRPLALQQYRRYLELDPNASTEVRAAVSQLERELNPPPTIRTPAASVPPIAVHAPGPAPRTNPPPGAVAAERSMKPATEGHMTATNHANVTTPPATATAASPRVASRPLELVPVTRPTPTASTAAPTLAPTLTNTASPKIIPPGSEKPPLEVTRVRDDLVVRPPQEVGASGAVASTTTPGGSATRSVETTPPPPKKGFFSRINPFSRGARETNSADSSPASPARDLVRPEGLPELAPAIARYTYVSPKRPSDGNREAANADFKRGVKAQKAGDRVRAAAEYQAAVRADPGFFDAYYNLGLVALDSGDARLSLWAYEIALAIQPDSADARYNLSLALKAGGYPLDASDQLQIILQQNPDDARAHLSLANLFAQQLKQPRRARDHYLRVLDLNPKHPDAATIRYWLAANP